MISIRAPPLRSGISSESSRRAAFAASGRAGHHLTSRARNFACCHCWLSASMRVLCRCSCTHISGLCETLGMILGGSDAFDRCSVTWCRRVSAVPTHMPAKKWAIACSIFEVTSRSEKMAMKKSLFPSSFMDHASCGCNVTQRNEACILYSIRCVSYGKPYSVSRHI